MMMLSDVKKKNKTEFYFSIVFRVALSIPPEMHGLMEGRAKCLMYDVNYTEVKASGVEAADPHWPVKPCDHGWEFNHTVIPYSSISTEVSDLKYL